MSRVKKCHRSFPFVAPLWITLPLIPTLPIQYRAHTELIYLPLDASRATTVLPRATFGRDELRYNNGYSRGITMRLNNDAYVFHRVILTDDIGDAYIGLDILSLFHVRQLIWDNDYSKMVLMLYLQKSNLETKVVWVPEFPAAMICRRHYGYTKLDHTKNIMRQDNTNVDCAK